MVDIQGLEDFFGDMDFKVGGTHKGITAIQVDMKVHGISYDVIRSALDKTYKARCYILDEIMLKAIPEVRPELSQYAPKMLTLTIDTEKIREVIGSGGKVIQKIWPTAALRSTSRTMAMSLYPVWIWTAAVVRCRSSRPLPRIPRSAPSTRAV